ncbi:MAG: hypothetical protein NTW29_09185 [Bacteroidetes bacterium]|nr:hypothetical protein [Bacteroidota bacterium]
MDIMDEGLPHFWRMLNTHNVKYIMAGGFVVWFYGYNHAADNMAIWLIDSPPNVKKFRAAFHEAGYGDFPTFENRQFVPGWTQYYIADGLILDIMTTMKGLEGLNFDECYEMANKADLGGVIVPFLHINHLLANKKAVARPKDQLDVMELEKIKKHLDSQTGK